MNRPLPAAVIVALFLFGCGPSLYAQASPGPKPPHRDATSQAPADSTRDLEHEAAYSASPNTFGVWIGGSVSPGGLFGNLPNGHLSLLGVRYSRRLLPRPPTIPGTNRDVVLTFTFDVIPSAWLSIPKGTPPGALSPLRPSLKDTGLSTIGLGAYPLGLQLRFRPGHTVEPFVAGHTGILYFLDPFPDARGRHLNFATGVGGGIRVHLPFGTALTVGYRYHHLSNGFRASINPGLDGNVLYLGFDLAP